MASIVTATGRFARVRNGQRRRPRPPGRHPGGRARALTLLQGPSGSGKTTLINLLGALDYPTCGAVVFEGTPLETLSEVQRDDLRRLRMGFVFQSVGLIALMSALRERRVRPAHRGPRSAGRRKRAEQCLAFVGLHERMHHRPERALRAASSSAWPSPGPSRTSPSSSSPTSRPPSWTPRWACRSSRVFKTLVARGGRHRRHVQSRPGHHRARRPGRRPGGRDGWSMSRWRAGVT